jgi:hypothetical protein
MFFTKIAAARNNTTLVLIVFFLSITAFLLTIFVPLLTKKITASHSEKIIHQCSEEVRWEICYADHLSETVSYKGGYFPYLLSLIQESDYKTNNCHWIAHNIGQKYAINNPTEPFRILKINKTDLCGGGLIHGVFEGIRVSDPTFRMVPANIIRLCDEIPITQNSHEYCYHVIGHLALVESKAQVNAALGVCQQLPIETQYSCFTGVFMESTQGYNLASHNLPLPPIWTPEVIRTELIRCNNYAREIQTACWEEAAHMLVTNSEASTEKTFNNCLRAPTIESQQACVTHASELIMITPQVADSEIKDLCSPLHNNEIAYTDCITSVIDLATSSIYKKIRIPQLCESVPESLRARTPCPVPFFMSFTLFT